MKKHLYFICPTDYLEPVINTAFKNENYYITSLGNSIIFNSDIIDEINMLIAIKDIKEITFVLADTNQIISDAIENQDFTDVRGLRSLHYEMTKQRKYKEIVWGNHNIKTPIISYHLNQKKNEFISRLRHWDKNSLDINTKIYNNRTGVFDEVFSDLIYRKHFSLN